MKEPLLVLLLEAVETEARRVRDAVPSDACDISVVHGLREALERLRAQAFDAVIVGLHVPDALRPEALARIRAVSPDIPLVLLIEPRDHDPGAERRGVARDDGIPDDVCESPIAPRGLLRAIRLAVDRGRIAAAVRDLDARCGMLFEHAADLGVTIAPDGTVTDVNQRFEALTGRPRAECVGQPAAQLWHPADQPMATHAVQQVLRGVLGPSRDLRLRTKNGEPVIGHFALVPVTAAGRITGVIGLARDVSELRRLQGVGQETARTDVLTGLANRRGCEDALVREAARATRENSALGIVLFDIDHFKKVNDTYGHEAGDAILRAVSEVLRGLARASDVPGRWGGEELLAVLPGVGVHGARQFAERVRSAVAALSGLPCPVTISAGAAEWTKGQEVKTVLARADKMLYEAKAAGRNRVF